MSKLLCLVLASALLAGCVPPYHFQAAPRPSRRYYQNRQRVHQHERYQARRQAKAPIYWSGQ